MIFLTIASLDYDDECCKNHCPCAVRTDVGSTSREDNYFNVFMKTFEIQENDSQEEFSELSPETLNEVKVVIANLMKEVETM